MKKIHVFKKAAFISFVVFLAVLISHPAVIGAEKKIIKLKNL